MAKYAVNPEGIQAMQTMANAILNAVSEIESATSVVRRVADENPDSLGPHKDSLDAALEDIEAAIKNSTDPASDVAERLEEVAEGYQDVIDNDNIRA